MGNYKTLTLKNVKKNKLTLKVNKKFTVKTKPAAAKGVKVRKHRAVCLESSDTELQQSRRRGRSPRRKQANAAFSCMPRTAFIRRSS